MKKRHNWYLTLGLALTIFMLVFIAVGFFYTPYDPSAVSGPDKFAPPSARHLFGCDHMGRDMLSRTLEGAGSTLVIALAIVAFGLAGGFFLGAFTGYYGGIADVILMRLSDVIAAFPSILLALVIIAVTGPGKTTVIIALGILFIPSFARLTRGEFIKYRDREFVQAARLMGVSGPRIMFAHILPNTWPVLLSGITIGFNNAVLAEASMSFLGVGVTPREASLGRMLSEGRTYLFSAPWAVAFPALTVILLILGVGMVGEGLRERSVPLS